MEGYTTGEQIILELKTYFCDQVKKDPSDREWIDSFSRLIDRIEKEHYKISS